MSALTDATDRARLAALALVGAGLIVAITFVWLQLAVLRPPGGGALTAPAAVVENAAAGVVHASAQKSGHRFSDRADAQAERVRR